jgi:hypothetical protein
VIEKAMAQPAMPQTHRMTNVRVPMRTHPNGVTGPAPDHHGAAIILGFDERIDVPQRETAREKGGGVAWE